MTRELRDIWRHSALPVILILGVIVGVGVWLQGRAIRVQDAPLVIEVGGGTGTVDLEASAEEPGPAVVGVDAESREGTAAGTPTASNAADAARAAFAAGLVSQRAGDSAAAALAYRRVLELRPTFWEAAYNLGLVLLAADRPAEAATALSGALALGGGERRAKTLLSLAAAYTELSRLADAERAYEDAINLLPGDPRPRVGLARLYHQRMDRPADALRLYREAVRVDEQHAPAWLGMASLRLKQGDPQQAERLLERAVALDPASEESRIALAALLVQRGETARAREQLTWLVEHVEAPVEAWFRLGRLDYGQEQFQLAADEYRKAFAASGGTHVASLNNLGLSLKSLGDIAGARKSFEEALLIAPDSTAALYNIGLLALDADDLPAAQARFARAVAIDPTYAEAWYNLGLVYGLREAHTEAIAAYREALKLDPTDGKARLNLAVQYRRSGEPERAVEQYRSLLAERPSYAPAWFNLAIVLRELNRPSEAETAYRTAIRIEPGEQKYRSGLALLYADEDRPADAARLLQEALEIDPGDAQARFNLAVQRRRLGRTDLAIEEARRAVALETGFKKGWLLLADLLAATNDHRGAADALSRALAADPADPLTHYELGKQQYELGEYPAAVASYRQALKERRDNPWIWYHLGKAEQALGQVRAAQESWKASLAIDPDMARYVSRQVGEPRDAVSMIRAQLAAEPGSVPLRLALADQLQRAGDGSEAIAEVTAVLKERPEEASAWKTLAGIYVDQEAFAAGEEALARARSLLPQDPEVAFQLGRILVRREKLSQALPHLSYAAGHSPDPLPSLRLLGNVQYDLRDYPAAIETLTRAVARQPDHGDTLIDLGKAFYRKKDYTKALERFAEARRLMPEYPWSGIWLGRAYVGLGDLARAEAVYLQVTKQDPGFVQGYLSLGDLAEHKGDRSAARDHYRRVLQIDPLNQTARERLVVLKE